MFTARMAAPDRMILTGRLDAASAAEAELALSQLTSSTEVDFDGLDYISSAGIGILVKALLRLQIDGHTLRLVRVQPRVRAIFHFAGLESTFGMD